jgi:Mn2+/Fe2+ NRAMP family transporter
MFTTAATLHATGNLTIQTSSQAAEALRPVDEFAFGIFALGLIGTGFLAVPVLAGSAAYALGEACKWPIGLARKPMKATTVYVTAVVATAVGSLISFSPLDPIKALFWSAVINSVVAAQLCFGSKSVSSAPNGWKPGHNERMVNKRVLKTSH